MARLSLFFFCLILGECSSFSLHKLLHGAVKPSAESYPELISGNHDKAGRISNDNNHLSQQSLRRGDFCSLLISGVLATTLAPAQATAAEENANAQPSSQDPKQGEVAMFKTNSGLKYLELKPGSGPSPRYGQLCAIDYTAYMKLPTEAQPQKFDSNAFLIKHGNGRVIAGLDEGIHTMKVGEKRRLIIPPKLGYVQSGLGPIPELPWNRWSLNNLLDKMIAQRGGNLIFEVELKSVIDDEADQGYYEDLSPTPEEFERLRLDFQEKNAAANVAREAAERSNL